MSHSSNYLNKLFNVYMIPKFLLNPLNRIPYSSFNLNPKIYYYLFKQNPV